MIAIPVNQKGEEPVVSEIFAMSKWFVIIDKDIVTFEKNIYNNGAEVSTWLKDMGVDKIVTHKIGRNTFDKLNNLHISCLYTDIHVKVTDIIAKAKGKKLHELNIQDSVFDKECKH